MYVKASADHERSIVEALQSAIQSVRFEQNVEAPFRGILAELQGGELRESLESSIKELQEISNELQDVKQFRHDVAATMHTSSEEEEQPNESPLAQALKYEEEKAAELKEQLEEKDNEEEKLAWELAEARERIEMEQENVTDLEARLNNEDLDNRQLRQSLLDTNQTLGNIWNSLLAILLLILAVGLTAGAYLYSSKQVVAKLEEVGITPSKLGLAQLHQH